jgi:hypothetical protein
MVQMARNAVDDIDGALFRCDLFCTIAIPSSVHPFEMCFSPAECNPFCCRLILRAPSAFAERWVRCIKSECLSKLILFGEVSLRLPAWRNHYRNGAGDLEVSPEIIIEDPGAEDMERLFGSDLDS